MDFADAIMLVISIPDGQDLEHALHLRHKSKYRLILLEKGMSLLSAPWSMEKNPLETEQSFPVILYIGHSAWQSPHFEHL